MKPAFRFSFVAVLATSSQLPVTHGYSCAIKSGGIMDYQLPIRAFKNLESAPGVLYMKNLWPNKLDIDQIPFLKDNSIPFEFTVPIPEELGIRARTGIGGVGVSGNLNVSDLQLTSSWNEKHFVKHVQVVSPTELVLEAGIPWVAGTIELNIQDLKVPTLNWNGLSFCVTQRNIIGVCDDGASANMESLRVSVNITKPMFRVHATRVHMLQCSRQSGFWEYQRCRYKNWGSLSFPVVTSALMNEVRVDFNDISIDVNLDQIKWITKSTDVSNSSDPLAGILNMLGPGSFDDMRSQVFNSISEFIQKEVPLIKHKYYDAFTSAMENGLTSLTNSCLQTYFKDQLREWGSGNTPLPGGCSRVFAIA